MTRDSSHRSKPGDWEKVLSKELQKMSRLGYRFRRHHPIGSYTVDFCCVEAGLVLEIDVDRHKWRRQRDPEKANLLRRSGYGVMRFWDREVLNDPSRVARTILHELNRARKKNLNT